jgi:hypothetical protein
LRNGARNALLLRYALLTSDVSSVSPTVLSEAGAMSGRAVLVIPFLFAAIAIAVTRVTAEDSYALMDLQTLRWEYRLFLINEPDDPQVLLRRLNADRAAIEERRVAWFVLAGDRIYSNYPGEIAPGLASRLREERNFSAGDVLLIGLDGGTKLRLPSADLDVLYSAIDSMPMRRYER